MAKGKYEEWLRPDGLLRLQGWARDGLSDEQIAKNMGIGVRTLYEWKDRYPQIAQTLKEKKDVADREVENALYKSATGYTVKVKKPVKVKTEKQVAGKGRIVEEHIEYIEEEIHVPPSNVAQIFWLKNRKPDVWRDKREVENNDPEILQKALNLLGGISDVIE